MNAAAGELDRKIEALLADPAWLDHPLREALAALWERYLAQLHRLDRIASLSDRFQALVRDRDLTRTEQFEKRLRQVEKMTRISDGYQEMMRELNLQLQQASTHDLLTGLPNRRFLAERLKQEAERSRRSGEPLCVALADVDRFKHVNDSWGHEVGDIALRAVAQAMDRALREGDLCGRWGGEEFLVILPATRLDDAMPAAERILDAVRDVRVEGIPAEHRITISIGVAQWSAQERPEATLARADVALFEAKGNGRDRVMALT
ncbi:MAG: biofilm regulation diguanylate cyclase SiaD [Xanthomonadales bacterium]|nr:biofilm regulation diguanylate cyclase SiaD [Xanthomonadales bacterium]